MSESATVMIPETMPLFGPVQLAAFLARYSGRTREAYALDLKDVLHLVRRSGGRRCLR